MGSNFVKGITRHMQHVAIYTTHLFILRTKFDVLFEDKISCISFKLNTIFSLQKFAILYLFFNIIKLSYLLKFIVFTN